MLSLLFAVLSSVIDPPGRQEFRFPAHFTESGPAGLTQSQLSVKFLMLCDLSDRISAQFSAVSEFSDLFKCQRKTRHFSADSLNHPHRGPRFAIWGLSGRSDFTVYMLFSFRLRIVLFKFCVL